MANPNINNQRQYALQNGMVDPTQPTQNADDDKKNEWQRMLAMLAMSNQTDPATMWGFLLGNGLGGLGAAQKAKVDRRGEMKGKLYNATPDERQQLLSDLQKTDPSAYERWSQNPNYADWFNNTAPQADTAQPDLTGINPNARAVLQAEAGLLGDPSKLQFENLPAVDVAFQQPDYSFEDKDKWNLQEYIKRMGWNGNAY